MHPACSMVYGYNRRINPVLTPALIHTMRVEYVKDKGVVQLQWSTVQVLKIY
jgi:hypothetical protein